MPILDQHGSPIQPATKSHRPIRARYDSAGPGIDNERHWAAADSLSSVSANAATVRATLRERSRYEVANNSYARGILNTLSAYTVGSGPTLQLTYRGPNPEPQNEISSSAQAVEHLWSNWAYSRKLAQKLGTMQMALDCDGEAFAMLTDGATSATNPVGLDLRLYEADHFDDYSGSSAFADDAGVRIGPDGNATEYAFLRDHPGDALTSLASFSSEWISADNIIHLFRRDRPGQLRGIPKTTPALPLFAQLRRFTLATITAAETAADFSAVLSGGGHEGETAEPWDRLSIERGALLTVPDGMTLSQLRSEHPNATYDEFVKAILREIARCLGVPSVLGLGDASSYNYSSGRLDLQAFTRQMEVERSNILELDCLDRLWSAWLHEALLIPDFLPPAFAENASYFEWSWRWPSAGHIDRKKESDGQASELANNTTTLAREYAKQGLDWETELKQRARELTRMRELGLTLATSQPEPPNENEENQ